MNLRKSLLTLAAILGSTAMWAQEAEQATEYVFQPHWYGQLQAGAQETLGEGSFSKLISFNFQASAGYKFTPLFGARLGVNAYQSKGNIRLQNPQTYQIRDDRWKFNYVAPMVDFTVDLTNLFGGYDATRKWEATVFVGAGVNIAFCNDEANKVNQRLSTEGHNALRNIWDGTKARLTGRAGLAVDYWATDRLAIGAEIQANILNDCYNSKRADNADWYFNAYLGVKYCFNARYTKRPAVVVEPEVVYVDRIVEKIVEVPAPAQPQVATECPTQPLRRDIFFTISNAKISLWEMQKVEEVANYLKENPQAKVTITGYADHGTGSKAFNLKISKQRAQAVTDALVKKFGIAADRITCQGMTYEDPAPFSNPQLNRVAICVAE